ncbi:hypothetical protein Acife_2331 [Acidithiobacillus ferrivorans SS3]|uniref:Uncharacterized protein n=1 Tax=Acidithiobacillus ferrivorans SS3 TaxID=743299 RepID=G0JP23_9PROT|nr:hypothetical protein Acife_2331 [Acidithiobacillus ferrivorans SS3]
MREIKPTAPPTLSALLQGFFAEYMILKKAVTARPEQESPHLLTTVIG